MSETYSKKLVFIASFVGMTFFGISVISMGTILPSISEKFGLDELGASFVVTFLPAGILIGSVVFGPFVDRFGYKFLLIFSSLLTIVGLAWLSWAESLTAVQFAVFLTGIGGGILNGETNTLVSDISGDNRNANLSLLGIFFGVGALGIPIMMGSLSKHFSFETILASTSLVMLLFTISMTFIKFPKPKHAQGFPLKEGFKLLKQPLLLLLSLVLFMQSGLEGISNNWITTYLEKSALANKEQALFGLSCMVLGMTLTRLVLGFALKKVWSYGVLISGMVTCILGISILIFIPKYYIVALLLMGIGFAPVFPVILGYIGTLYANFSGTAFGIALVIGLIGNSALNFLTGFFASTFGIEIFPFILFVSALILVFLYSLTLKNEKLITKVK
jgi:MFS transporter, FHS family, glucose/mannose:H+ symporter